uniref:BART domain-containing protein n=1 Tax=Panagrolaimus sp. ES5 TaxID=591445 RepID=A0AC34G2A8_9BILA
MAETQTLRSTIDPEFSIEVDERVIKSSLILTNVQANTNDRGEVKVQLNQKCLEKFVQFHNHFPSATAPKDIEWTNAFFREMPENEFKELCRQADFLDSERFIEAAGDFALCLVEQNDVAGIQRYFDIVDDYTPVERRTMEDHMLEFFTGASIVTDADAVVSGEASADQS